MEPSAYILLALLAGRVQSVALRLVCERDAAVEKFVPLEFWRVHVQLRLQDGQLVQVMAVGASDEWLDAGVDSSPSLSPSTPFCLLRVVGHKLRLLGY